MRVVRARRRYAQAPAGAEELAFAADWLAENDFLSPLPGLFGGCGTGFPRLAPWTIIGRHSVVGAAEAHLHPGRTRCRPMFQPTENRPQVFHFHAPRNRPLHFQRTATIKAHLPAKILTYGAFDTIYFFINLCEKSGVSFNKDGRF